MRGELRRILIALALYMLRWCHARLLIRRRAVCALNGFLFSSRTRRRNHFTLHASAFGISLCECGLRFRLGNDASNEVMHVTRHSFYVRSFCLHFIVHRDEAIQVSVLRPIRSVCNWMKPSSFRINLFITTTTTSANIDLMKILIEYDIHFRMVHYALIRNRTHMHASVSRRRTTTDATEVSRILLRELNSNEMCLCRWCVCWRRRRRQKTMWLNRIY